MSWTHHALSFHMVLHHHMHMPSYFTMLFNKPSTNQHYNLHSARHFNTTNQEKQTRQHHHEQVLNKDNIDNRTQTQKRSIDNSYIQILIFGGQHDSNSSIMVLAMLGPMNSIAKGVNMLGAFGMARITLSSLGIRHTLSSTSPW